MHRRRLDGCWGMRTGFGAVMSWSPKRVDGSIQYLDGVPSKGVQWSTFAREGNGASGAMGVSDALDAPDASPPPWFVVFF